MAPNRKTPAKMTTTRSRKTTTISKVPTIAPVVETPDRMPFFNRELSWLAFNRRVLEQAMNPAYPLCERMRFLAFVTSNLDEFFEIRVSGLMQQVESGVSEKGPDNLGPKEQIRRINTLVTKLVRDQYDTWMNKIIPAFAQEDVHFLNPEDLNRKQTQWLDTYFEDAIYPVLTPLAIDPSHPFPQIANKSLNILVGLKEPKRKRAPMLMAIIPVPRILPRVVEVAPDQGDGKHTFVFLSDIIRTHAQRLFPGYKIDNATAFRVTRNSDLYIDEEEVENLLLKIEEELYNIRKGDAVRLEIREGADPDLLRELMKLMNLGSEHVYHIAGNLNLTRLMAVYDEIDRPDLKFPAFHPRIPKKLQNPQQIFKNIRGGDIFLHHPFDSFSPVVDFIDQAAKDPNVFAIKQTLYRTSGDSPIVNALKLASHNGKQVTALIELKARFDEANNIEWARQLEEVGVHVVYGLVGLKTHCKTSLVVRQENGQMVRYCHLGTGNYNPKTARLYTDCSFFTANEDTTKEVADLFNTLTGFAKKPQFNKLLCAPFNLHSRTQELILQEAENAKKGKPARIFAKCNSLIDSKTIENLYIASQAGVKIDLVIRGVCGLVPGLAGISDNIRVHSILGRYLEHSRIFYFENGGNKEGPLIFMGSADWMPRNFFRRIEAVFPVEDKRIRDQIVDIIEIYLKDNVQAKFLKPNGSYANIRKGSNSSAICAQDIFSNTDETQPPFIVAQ
ncbi:MAG: polyphosphate kinase 1 [Opitutales bacterium]